MSDTQLTVTTDGYNPKSQLIFSQLKKYTKQDPKDPNKSLKFSRVFISSQNPNGTKGDLVLAPYDPEQATEAALAGDTSKLMFSFGISENTSQETGAVTGFSMPLCLFNKDGVQDHEQKFFDVFGAIVEECKSYIVSIREQIGDNEFWTELEERDLRSFNPIYYSKDKITKQRDKTRPTLYAKIPTRGEELAIDVDFFDMNNEPIDPETLKGSYQLIFPAVHIHSIYFGAKPSLQVKLYEANCMPVGRQKKRLLSRAKGNSKVTISRQANPLAAPDDEEEKEVEDAGEDAGDASDGSLLDDGDEEPAPKPKPARKPVRRVRRARK